MSVPTYVEIPSGTKSATFTIKTSPVGRTIKVAITAELVVKKSVTLTINP